jgi:polyhydroxybutyrate depolymerase
VLRGGPWAVDGCAAPVTSTAGPVTRVVAGCPDGRAVELVTVDGAGHQWPGAGPKLAGDPPSAALDATRELWAFFSRHPAGGPS